jgi:hypothetical protein
MNQQEQPTLQNQTAANMRVDLDDEAQQKSLKAGRREWLPEDDDDWYEPDCARCERGS